MVGVDLGRIHQRGAERGAEKGADFVAAEKKRFHAFADIVDAARAARATAAAATASVGTTSIAGSSVRISEPDAFVKSLTGFFADPSALDQRSTSGGIAKPAAFRRRLRG